MSAALVYYLANTLMRGGIIAALLLALEFFLKRKLVFAGGRWIFLFALLLILLPFEKVSWPRGGEKAYAPAYHIEVPDWNAAWSPAPAAAVINPAVSPAKAAPAWTLFEVLAVLYGVGVLFLSAKQIGHFFIWRNRIRRCIAITGGRVFEVFLESKRLTGLERFPVRLLDGGELLPVAACFGTLRRGAVLCPLGEYDKYPDAELRMILIHELEHLRRNDNPVALFLTALSNFFFVNPFVRLLFSRWAMIAELDCDERVRRVLRLDRPGMAQYAGLLLASQTGRRVLIPGRGLGASARNLKLRIQEFAMKRTKLQLLRYVLGIGVLFALGSLLMPELRAEAREAIDPLVAKNLPAGTGELVYFNAAALDRNGVGLLEKAAGISGLEWKVREIVTMMLSTEKNRGRFYLAAVPKSGRFILLKNGTDSDEMVIPPGIANRGMTIRKMEGGYFALLPVGSELPALGLPEELQKKIAAAPDEVLRSCNAGGIPSQVSVVNRNGVYMLSAILPEAAGKAPTVEAMADNAVFYLPEDKRDAMRAFIRENLKITVGQKECRVEFPLNEQTLALWGDYSRKIKEEWEKENAPRVVALSPKNGATGVDPNLKEIKVTFDRPMNTSGWSFCQKSDVDFPETLSKPSYDESRTVITLPVRLEPGKTYNIYLNSPPYIGFRSAEGGVLESVHYTFTTAGSAE